MINVVRQLAPLLLVLALPLLAIAQTKTDSDVTTTLRELQTEVRALRSEVLTLSNLLKPLVPPPPVSEIIPTSVNVADQPRKGSTAARVAIIEFSDFECPFCGRHAASALKDIQRMYIETGKVQYIFRHLPLVELHPSARRVAEVAACAHEQNKFWAFHDQAFANQKALQQPDLVRYAEAEGLDTSVLASCLRSGRPRNAVDRDVALANKLEITGTPTFLMGLFQADGTVQVSKKIVGGHPFSVFQAAFDDLFAHLTR